MLAISCNGCPAVVYAECELAPQNARCGKPDCAHADPDGFFDAIRGCGCCAEDHHHGQAAAACPADHASAACPLPPGQCAVRASGHPGAPLGEPPGDCPGGHCGKGVPGCAVCRPLTITMLPGSSAVHHVSEG